MQKIIYFLIRNKNFILFLALLTVSLAVNFNFNEYNRSKIMNSSNFIISSLYEVKFSVTKYLNLEYQNKLLIDENLKLKEIIYNSKNPIEISKKIEEMDFDFIGSSVIKNSYTKTKNYITIDKGLIDSITIDNGVISSNGVVGIIDKSTSNYSRVISILNEKPKYRKEIVTLIKPESKLKEIVPLIKKQIKLNYQVFWVCPLIEQSKKLNFSSAKNKFEDISKLFPDNVGLIHGNMSIDQRNKVLNLFINKKIKI